ncbi:MAG TPA: TatD family hydrolase [bacterium]|jgi:TatD DNase family protein
MIDTHSHLYYPEFESDLNEVIARAQGAGVTRIITIAVDKETAEACLTIAARFPGVVFAAVGVHPSEVDKVSEEDLLWIEAVAGDPSVVAIGEIGLDIYRGETNLAKQEALFERMLQLAIHAGLPAIIHHRSAGQRTIEIVKRSGLKRGVFHCFSEDEPYARQVLEQGLSLSFTGNITYKNSPLPQLVQQLPLSRIMLETDAPFMAPMPYRGKRCEPMHVREVAAKHAQLFNLPLEEIDRQTTAAALQLFFPHDA